MQIPHMKIPLSIYCRCYTRLLIFLCKIEFCSSGRCCISQVSVQLIYYRVVVYLRIINRNKLQSTEIKLVVLIICYQLKKLKISSVFYTRDQADVLLESQKNIQYQNYSFAIRKAVERISIYKNEEAIRGRCFPCFVFHRNITFSSQQQITCRRQLARLMYAELSRQLFLTDTSPGWLRSPNYYMNRQPDLLNRRPDRASWLSRLA